MKTFITALLLVLAVGAVQADTKKSGPFSIGISKPASKGHVLAASATTATGLTVDWQSHIINKDGSAQYALQYFNAAGVPFLLRQIYVDAACTTAKDAQGTVIYTTTGAGDPLCVGLANQVTRTNSLIANGAAGGKFNL